MDCPGCAKPLDKVDYEEVEVDSCGKCGGFWLDQGELGKIVRVHDETFSSKQIDEARERVRLEPASGVPTEKSKLSCPHCGKDCVKSVIQGVHIDRCPDKGGIWLDKGELEMLQTAAEECSSVFTDEQKKFYRERARKNAEQEAMGLFDCVSLYFRDLLVGDY